MKLDLVAATAYLTCGALMFFLGLVVFRESPRQRVNRATAAMLVFAGLGPVLGAYANLGETTASTSPLFQDVFARFAFLWEFFFPATVLFALVFPTTHPWLRRHPRLVPLLFVPHAAHVGLVLAAGQTDALLARVDSASLPASGIVAQAMGLLRVGADQMLKFHVRLFSFVNLGMAAASLVLLSRSARKALQPKLRDQLRTIRTGLSFGLGLYIGGELLPRVFGVPLARAVSLPLVTVSLLVGAASIVVAIVRLGFLDVRFIVRRGLVYGLLSGVIVALYLFVAKQIDRVSGALVGQQIPFFETTFLVLSLFLLQPVLAAVERLVDRGYARDRDDLRNALGRLADQVALVLDPDEVAATVAATIRRELVLRAASVVTRDRRTGRFTLTLSRDGTATTPDWKAGGALFDAVADRREPVPVAELVEGCGDPARRELLARETSELGAELAYPLHAMSREGPGSDLVGVLLLGRKVTETRITFEESSLVSLIARQVGISLMNGALHEEQVATRLFEEEVATARRIQQQLLPDTPPALAGWQLCATNTPSRQVGGDYHDFLPLGPDRLGIAIGDVSGKGVPAALLMSNLQAALRVRTLSGHPLDRVVEDVNRQICRNTGHESFISFFVGELEPREGHLSFVNAGHNAPLLVRRDGSVQLLETGGLLLGVVPDACYQRGEIRLDPGDLLVMYTDGVTEAWNSEGDMFSEERLLATLVRDRERSAVEVLERILEEVRTFQQGRLPDDDLTLVLLKRVEDGVAAESLVAAQAAVAAGGAA
jgi:serine phosphatase RsbU (regulator of sigma subunit)